MPAGSHVMPSILTCPVKHYWPCNTSSYAPQDFNGKNQFVSICKMSVCMHAIHSLSKGNTSCNHYDMDDMTALMNIHDIHFVVILAHTVFWLFSAFFLSAGNGCYRLFEPDVIAVVWNAAGGQEVIFLYRNR